MMQNNSWSIYTGQSLSTDESIFIFKIKIKEYDNIASNAILSTSEINRSNRFYKQTDKENFITRRLILRTLLGGFLNIDPRDIKFQFNKNKKPFVHGINFSTSHSNEYMAIGISHFPVGIDIEYINRTIAIDDLINYCCSDEESSFILNSNDSILNFYKLWSRKEALLKATGEGLIDNIGQVSVLLNSINRNNEWHQIRSILLEEYFISISFPCKESIFNFWNKIEL